MTRSPLLKEQISRVIPAEDSMYRLFNCLPGDFLVEDFWGNIWKITPESPIYDVVSQLVEEGSDDKKIP